MLSNRIFGVPRCSGGSRSVRSARRRSARLRGRPVGRGAGVGRAPVAELLVGQHRAPRADVLDDLRGVLGVQRADVLAVDRGHRRDVARAQALERATWTSAPSAAADHRLEELVGAEQRAARCSCRRRRRVTRARRQLEHVVEAGDRGQVGGGELHDRGHLVDRPRRAPAVDAWAACSAGIAAERRSGYLAIEASISLTQSLGHRRRARDPGRSPEAWSGRRRRPSRGRGSHGRSEGRVGGDRRYRSIPPRIGSSIASVAIRSAM